MSENTALVSAKMLLDEYLTVSMEKYFYKKLPNEEAEYVKLKIIELLKYLHLSHHTFGNIPFADEIDDIWHLWILQTIQYRELMEKLPGKIFINHSSNDYVDEQTNLVSEEKEFELQISFLASYVKNFGGFTEDTIKFWPMTNLLMDTLRFDIKKLNDFLERLDVDSLLL